MASLSTTSIHQHVAHGTECNAPVSGKKKSTRPVESSHSGGSSGPHSGESKESSVLEDWPDLGFSEYVFKTSLPDDIVETSGVGVIYAKKSVYGGPFVFTAKEDRTPIHQGPLKDPNKPLVFDEQVLNEAYGKDKVEEAERLFGLLNPYRYKRVGLREADKNLVIASRLAKCLTEELQQRLTVTKQVPDFYLGRKSIDRKTKKLRVSWQPWFIVFDDETEPDEDALVKRKRADIWSAKSFKFLEKNLPDDIDFDGEFWEVDGEKYALNNPYQEVEVKHDENGNVDASHFKTQADAKKYLVDYIKSVNDAKISGSTEILGKGRKGDETFADFGLGRWGEEGLIMNWSKIMDLMNAKVRPTYGYGARGEHDDY
jgi:hypothetical protein